MTSSHQGYRDTTLVLETEFSTDGGRVRLVDAMPPRDERVDVVRVVEGLAGEVEMRMEWSLRFVYGKAQPWVRRLRDESGAEVVVAVAGPDAVALHSDVEVTGADGKHVAVFTVAAGERVAFTMTWYPSHREAPGSIDAREGVERAERYWRDWIGRCTYDGPYVDAVRRSLVTLKALTFAPTGGMVAASTTSLPEALGGNRNWDYRYCWLRDATLTLAAFLDCGYEDEAAAWRDWLLRAIAGDPKDLQIVYGIAGERDLPERVLDHLGGYEGAARCGSATAPPASSSSTCSARS